MKGFSLSKTRGEWARNDGTFRQQGRRVGGLEIDLCCARQRSHARVNININTVVTSRVQIEKRPRPTEISPSTIGLLWATNCARQWPLTYPGEQVLAAKILRNTYLGRGRRRRIRVPTTIIHCRRDRSLCNRNSYGPLVCSTGRARTDNENDDGDGDERHGWRNRNTLSRGAAL